MARGSRVARVVRRPYARTLQLDVRSPVSIVASVISRSGVSHRRQAWREKTSEGDDGRRDVRTVFTVSARSWRRDRVRSDISR